MGTTVLQNGQYEPVHTKTVTVWPKPDKNGDGPEVTVQETDSAGNYLGLSLARDNDGNVIHEYLPPEGFTPIPTRDPGADGATASYVRADKNGRPLRNPKTGEAIGIVPGSALVEYPDGTHELLRDEFSQVLFGRAHTPVGGTTPAQEGGYRA